MNLCFSVACRSKGLIIASVVLNFVSILVIIVGCIVMSVIALYFGPCIYQYGGCYRELITGSYGSLIGLGVLAIILCCTLNIIVLHRLSKLKPLFYFSTLPAPMPVPVYSANTQQLTYYGNSQTQF